MSRILYIAPVNVEGDFLERDVEDAARTENDVTVVGFSRGPRHVEYHYYETLVLPDIIHTIIEAERLGYDAAVIGCFYDLGLQEGREVADEQETERRFVEAGQRAVQEDGAEVIILGCTASSGFFARLQHELGVPVIDPAIAAIKQAEQLIELRDRFGWAHAKIGGYESPPPAEIAAWRLREDFGADDVRNSWIFARPVVGAPTSD